MVKERWSKFHLFYFLKNKSVEMFFAFSFNLYIPKDIFYPLLGKSVTWHFITGLEIRKLD